METTMHLQLIRNATLRLTYAGREILIDPFLAERHSLPTIAGKSKNPTVDLPVTPDEVLRGVELVLVSHLHADHIDLTPPRIPTDLPVLGQPGDVDNLRTAGFTDVTGVEHEFDWNGIRIARTGGAHGSGPVREAMGEVSGFVLRAKGEPTVYVAGDTIWNDDVRAAIDTYHPDVIVTNSGGAMIMETLIMLDVEQTLAVARAAPQATVVATHLEAFDHATVTREDLRNAVHAAGLASRLLTPDDGETIKLGSITVSAAR
jgi:L-ascorbate metabolism protein UlaG (beta-lactamase superfamily)